MTRDVIRLVLPERNRYVYRKYVRVSFCLTVKLQRTFGIWLLKRIANFEKIVENRRLPNVVTNVSTFFLRI